VHVDLSPTPPDPRLQAAVDAALGAADVDLTGRPQAFASAWREAGLREGVEREPPAPRYTLSPRRMRGATRA
jgi:hypothetical protein